MKIEIIKMEDPRGYSVSNGDEESDNFAEWGEPLNATLGGKDYLIHVDIDDEGNVFNVSDFLAYEVKGISDDDIEVVEDDEDEDPDDDGDGEEVAA